MLNISENELRCKCRCIGREPLVERNLTWLQAVLQLLRCRLGKPVIVTSGHRCMEHNKRTVGAVDKSFHTKGLAADIDTSRYGQETIAQIEHWLNDNNIFYLCYKTHIHLDLRRQVA